MLRLFIRKEANAYPQTKTFFKKARHTIVDLASEQTLAKYWFSSIWNPWPRPPRLIIGNEIYIFRRERPDIKYSPFKRDAWRQWKFSLTSSRFKLPDGGLPAGSARSDAVVFHFRTEARIFTAARTWFYPFTGRIEAYTDNDLLLFAGFYLIEDFFEKRR